MLKDRYNLEIWIFWDFTSEANSFSYVYIVTQLICKLCRYLKCTIEIAIVHEHISLFEKIPESVNLHDQAFDG